MKQFFFLFALTFFSLQGYCQPTHTVTDPEKKYKEARDYIMKEQYAFAYPIVKELKQQYPDNTISDHAYINDDVQYFYIVCELKMLQDVGRDDAIYYIQSINNEPRRQIMSFHLAHYYFLKEDFEKTIEYYNIAGYENISNDQIADAKFEKAYAHFNLKQFNEAKPLFAEILQIPDNKYFIPANYYYGFIAYRDKQYDVALKSFRLVELRDEYKGVVPYYIAEIYYFQGKKEEALTYGESVLERGTTLYYEKQLKLLMGQLYFEKKDYKNALPLLEEYVNSSDKVSKEVLYELSYCYYKDNQFQKAIEGFKQLSNERDSMGQNSMYILGDLYLQTGDKYNARNAFQYSAYNSSNKQQQRISQFTYAKLSYELGFQDVALLEMRNYLKNYPNSDYDAEAKEILVNVLANTSSFSDALALYKTFDRPTANMQKVYPRILYGRAIELVNDQQLLQADVLFAEVMSNPLPGAVLPYVYFWRGEIAYRQERFDDAIRNLNQFLQSNAVAQGEANLTTARYNVGYSFLQKENYRQALSYFSQVAPSVTASSNTIELDAYLRLADCNYMLKDYTKANNMYEVLINLGSQSSDYATYQKAMIAGIKNSAEKIRILSSLIRQYSQGSLIGEANMEIASTHISDEKFNEAIPYLNTIIASADNGLKPRAYLKLGLAYYNSDHNKDALNSYLTLIQKYPQSPEADEALASLKDIYVSEGRPDEYVELMRKNGKNISVSQADSLSYTAASMRYENNDCAGAITAFSNYVSKYPQGSYVTDAQYFRSTCYEKAGDWQNAVAGFVAVTDKGLNKYFERSALAASRIYYFEMKDYGNAKKFFEIVRSNSVNRDNQLEALRGLVRSFYQLKDYSEAKTAALELLGRQGLSTDDKSIGNLVLGKSLQLAKDCKGAISSFRSVAAINKSAWGAEARYNLALCEYINNNLTASEKAATNVIRETGSYDFWVTKSYILLGDIFMLQKDYFNAKATYESVAKNALIAELKTEAQQKLEKAIAEEKQQSKIN